MDYGVWGFFLDKQSQSNERKSSSNVFKCILGLLFTVGNLKIKNKETLCNIDNVTVFKVNSLLSFIMYVKSYCPNAVKVL